MAVWDVAGSAAPSVCVLREARGPPLGGRCEGTLAAAVPATSGHRRIGSGSADRETVPEIQSYRRARRQAANTGQEQSRPIRRTSDTPTRPRSYGPV